MTNEEKETIRIMKEIVDTQPLQMSREHLNLLYAGIEQIEAKLKTIGEAKKEAE